MFNNFFVIPTTCPPKHQRRWKAEIQLLIVLFCTGCSTTQAPEILNAITEHNQALLVKQSLKYKSRGSLSVWQRTSSTWQRVYAIPVTLGRNGIAGNNLKREGDGHTPSGVYSITTAFGYADKIDTRLNYRQATTNDFWVDDVDSPQYNQWVQGLPNARSFEEMRRKDNLYSLGAVIEYNTNPIMPGHGSAIFLHIWRSYYKPTAGCVAVSQRNLRKLLKFLDAQENPVIILSN